MAVGSVNYPQPVMVNGYPCKNCTDVDLAKAHIDPQHPSAGPYGVNAKADPSLAGKRLDAATGAVTFGGSLGNNADNSGSSSAAPPSSPRGSQVDVSV
jgi:hypothetical protein